MNDYTHFLRVTVHYIKGEPYQIIEEAVEPRCDMRSILFVPYTMLQSPVEYPHQLWMGHQNSPTLCNNIRDFIFPLMSGLEGIRFLSGYRLTFIQSDQHLAEILNFYQTILVDLYHRPRVELMSTEDKM